MPPQDLEQAEDQRDQGVRLHRPIIIVKDWNFMGRKDGLQHRFITIQAPGQDQKISVPVVLVSHQLANLGRHRIQFCQPGRGRHKVNRLR